MWTMPIGYSRAFASVATAGAVAFTAGGVAPLPAAAAPVFLQAATVSAPVELTALNADSSLMDIIGSLTGLNFIIPFLNSPDSPLFPFVTAFETLGQALFVIPVTVAIGAPLLLVTEGFEGVQGLFAELGGIFGVVQDAFDNIMDWYATHNWLTGALLDPGSSAAVDLAGWAEAFLGAGAQDLVPPADLDAVFPADTVDAGAVADGFEAVLADFGLADLIG